MVDTSKVVSLLDASRQRLQTLEGVAFLFLGLLWYQYFSSLIPFWMMETYYEYGWFVPLAALFFLWRRWADYPPKKNESLNPPTAPLFALIAVALLCLIPLRIIEVQDPYWRAPRYLHFILVAGISHLFLAQMYSWQSSLKLLPLTIFCLSAAPLPYQLELNWIQSATQILMTISEPICHFQGFPVDQEGAALTLGGEVLQVNEECSGIRSFQSLLMTGLFFGELFLLPWVLRGLLVIVGVLLAFAFNVIRVVSLTAIYFDDGPEAFNKAHDTIGMLAFGASALILLGVGRLMAGPATPPARPKAS